MSNGLLIRLSLVRVQAGEPTFLTCDRAIERISLQNYIRWESYPDTSPLLKGRNRENEDNTYNFIFIFISSSFLYG